MQVFLRDIVQLAGLDASTVFLWRKNRGLSSTLHATPTRRDISCSKLNRHFPTFDVIGQEDVRTIFTNTLKNVDAFPEETAVKYRTFQIDIAVVAYAVN